MRSDAVYLCSCFFSVLIGSVLVNAATAATGHLGSWDDYYVGRGIPDLVAPRWSGEQYVGNAVVIDLTRVRDEPERVRRIVHRFNCGELDEFVLRMPSPLSVSFAAIDLNNDGYLDFVSGAAAQQRTYVWQSGEKNWKDVELPTPVGVIGGRFARVRFDGVPTLLVRSVAQRGAWQFVDDRWHAASAFVRGLDLAETRLMTSVGGVDRGMRFLDLSGDGRDELIIANTDQQVVLQWSVEEARWHTTGITWPDDAVFVTSNGIDAGCRLGDVNGDDRLDVLISNDEGSMVYLWRSEGEGFGMPVARERRGEEGAAPLPAFVKGGRPTGAWFDSESRSVMTPRDTPDADGSQPWNQALRFRIAFGNAVPGFARLVASDGAEDVWWDYLGEKSPNHFIRQEKKGIQLSWQTVAVPKDDRSDRVRFVFVGAMGYRSEPVTDGFVMTFPGAAPIVFDLSHVRQSWTNVDNTAALVFDPTWHDASDAAGYFFLTIDRSLLNGGEPMTVSVASLGEGSQRWFAIHPVSHPELVEREAKGQ